MKAVILAGGFGTRLSEETQIKPKPMVEVGEQPILWHILKIYGAHGVNEFVVCCGYKGDVIKDYFANYFARTSDVTFDMSKNEMQIERKHAEPWKVTLIDTGQDAMTGARIKRVRDYIGDETFCLTYGDGVSDVDITASIEFHKNSGRLCTLTAVRPPGRFGAVIFSGDEGQIDSFREKPRGDGGYINGGFFVVEPKVVDDYIGDDAGVVFEQAPLRTLASDGQLNGFRHEGFWQPMDTLRDKNLLEQLWKDGEAPWKVW
ncbi:MAG: glucose-1-phosphate cytidylyltransferase [Planctomycetota bacterium]